MVSSLLARGPGQWARNAIASTSRLPAIPLQRRQYATNPSNNNNHPSIPVIRSLAQLRRWRRMVRDQKLEVGVVPTVSTQLPLYSSTALVNPWALRESDHQGVGT